MLTRQETTPIAPYRLDASAAAPFEGDPATVCLLDEWLSDETLPSIAAENNLSEKRLKALRPMLTLFP